MIIAFAIILGMIVLIPVLAILIDSPLSEALARRIASRDDIAGSGARLDMLEKEVEYLSRTVESLRDESTFVRALVEGPDAVGSLPAPQTDVPEGED